MPRNSYDLEVIETMWPNPLPASSQDAGDLELAGSAHLALKTLAEEGVLLYIINPVHSH